MNTNVSDALLGKIAKLLALAADKSNEHEAAVAAAHAQRLLHEHNLSLAEVETRNSKKTATVGRRTEDRPVKSGSGTKWRIILASVVADCGFCRVLHTKFKGSIRLYWIGRETDVTTCLFVFQYLERELERLAKEYSDLCWKQARVSAKAAGVSFHEFEQALRMVGKHPLLSRRSWLEGAVAGVAETLLEEYHKRQASRAGTALVVSRKEELDQYIGDTFPKVKNVSQANKHRDSAAYTKGFQTGQLIRVVQGLPEEHDSPALTNPERKTAE